MSLRDAFRDVRDALEDVGVPYMVTGSVASSVHGVPRATQDIDIVIEPTREQLVALMARFAEPTYDTDVDDALDAFHLRSMFSVIDRRGIWKIDFTVRKLRPFSRKEFDRRQKIEILDIFDVRRYARKCTTCEVGVGKARGVGASARRRGGHYRN